MVCLDTSIVIAYLRGDNGIINLVNSYNNKEKIAITVITEYELLKHRDVIKRDLANKFMDSVKIYLFDRDSARKSSDIFIELKEKGKMANENDILIAGIAFANSEKLVTKDRHFKNIENDNILIV